MPDVDLGRVAPKLVIERGATDGAFGVGRLHIAHNVVRWRGEEATTRELREPQIIKVNGVWGISPELPRGNSVEQLREGDGLQLDGDIRVLLLILVEYGLEDVEQILLSPMREDHQVDLLLCSGRSTGECG